MISILLMPSTSCSTECHSKAVEKIPDLNPANKCRTESATLHTGTMERSNLPTILLILAAIVVEPEIFAGAGKKELFRQNLV